GGREGVGQSGQNDGGKAVDFLAGTSRLSNPSGQPCPLPKRPGQQEEPESLSTERNKMRISKRFTLAASAAVIALFASSAAMADGEKIVIGTEGAYPPFNNLESDGTLTGFDVDIAKALCEQMK